MVEDLLINLFKKDENISYSLNKIKKALATYHFDIKDIENALYSLRMNGIIYYDNNDETYKSFPNNYFIGKIEYSKKGFYSIIIDNSRYSIKKENLNSALNYDTVIVKKLNNGQYNVEQILERKNELILCEVQYDEKGEKTLVPLHVGYKFKVHIGSTDMKSVFEGQRLKIKIGTEKFNDAYLGKLIEVIGNKNEPDIEIKSLLTAYGFNLKSSDEALEQLKTIPMEVQPKELVGRLDLRDETIFTIDGDNTKDIDDAVSIKIDENGNYVLGVHIAHVSHYVPYNSPLFKDAAQNTTSVYPLNKVLPMLPVELSNGICSLNEREDRLTKSYFITYNKNGEVLDYKMVKSVINSKKKMNKSSVNKILEEGIVPEGYEPYVDGLKLMEKLCYLLIEQSKKRGFIDFASTEEEFVYDEDSKAVTIQKVVSHIGEKMIEHFMLAHNHAAPEQYYWQELPYVYRNHGIPDKDKICDTISTLKSIGYRVNTLKNVEDPNAIQALLNNLTNKEEFPILSNLILRSMQRAYYSLFNIGHFGLSLPYYAHRTSPIRRIADLINEILEDMYEKGEYPSKEMVNEIRLICERASMMERNADIVEHKAFLIEFIRSMENRIGDEFEAFVSDVTPKKVILKLTEGGEGIIDLYKLGIDYQYKEENKSIAIKGYPSFIIGRKINVILKETSMENLELYFSTPELDKNDNMKRTRKLS